MTRFLALLAGFLLAFTGVLLLWWFLWWLWQRREQEAEAPPFIEIEVPASPPEVGAEAGPAPAAEVEAPPPAEPDDLKRVEGIGPKISSVLQAAGVETFADLAGTDVARLEAILEAESPRLRRLADPSTWPQQAALAAAGDWEGLAALQGELKGGRRV